MVYNTLISAADLAQHATNKNWVIFDCRFSLSDKQAGAKAYRQGHLAGARYADLEKDLSGAVACFTGRHPLPNFKVLAQKLGQWGVNSHTQVVVYDDANGAFAGRFWWLLRCFGHENVAVLEGGLSYWLKQGYSVTTTLPQITGTTFRPYPNENICLSASEVEAGLARKSICLIDARTPERYRGEQEPIDPVAGHIPSALNRPFQKNLTPEGLFLPAMVLQKQFTSLLKSYSATQVVHNCGSGVTACHNLLAMEYAGLTGSKLYAGSWSEWITNKNRAIAKV